MSALKRISAWLVIATASALLAMSWITLALAQEAGNGDGADGDELALPTLVVVRIPLESQHAQREEPQDGAFASAHR